MAGCLPSRDKMTPKEKLMGIYQDMMQHKLLEFSFNWYLMNCVNLKTQDKKSLSENGSYVQFLPDFMRYFDAHKIIGGDGEMELADEFFVWRPFWEENIKFVMEMKEEKLKQVDGDHKIVEPEGGWTFDTWNQSVSAKEDRRDSVDDDPALRPWTIVKSGFGRELFRCGSARENVATTFLFHPKYGGTDIDVMHCLPLRGMLKDVPQRPGYTRILADSTRRYRTNGNNFMLTASCSEETLSNLTEMFQRCEEGYFGFSGPAVACYTDLTQTNKVVDIVNGFYLEDRQWPSLAEEWLRRRRPSGWPTQEVIGRAISHGTYVVPVCHPNSIDQDIEWRYSFSKPEKDLMLSINGKQRKCFMLTKHLCKLTLPGVKFFCSYFVKTSFFWMLEDLPAEIWNAENMGCLVDHLLDKIVSFFECRNLPNYFIRRANIIDHPLQKDVKTVLKALRLLRFSRNEALQENALKDVCLYCINHTVEPCDASSTLLIPQHEIVKILKSREYLKDSRLIGKGHIQKISEKYWELSRKSDSDLRFYEGSYLDLKKSGLFDFQKKLTHIELLLEVLSSYTSEEISKHWSKLSYVSPVKTS